MTRTPLRDLSALILTLVASGCGARETTRTLLLTDLGSVSAEVAEKKAAWRVREIRALALGELALNALVVEVFLDANGNGVLDEGEAVAAWRTDSPLPSRAVQLAGHLDWAAYAEGTRRALRLRTSLTYDDGSTEHEVVRALE